MCFNLQGPRDFPFFYLPTPNSLSFIITLTLKLFCIILPYLYVLIENFVVRFTIKHYYYISRLSQKGFMKGN